MDPINKIKGAKYATYRPQQGNDNSRFSNILNQKQGQVQQQPQSLEAPHSIIGQKTIPAGLTIPGNATSVPKPTHPDQAPESMIGEQPRMARSTHTQQEYIAHKNYAHLPKSLKSYRPLIEKHARLNGIDPNLLAGLIKQESNFQSQAVSHAGAMGLTQLMPGTAKLVGVKDPFNAEQSIAGGARYLGQMLKEFNGDVDLALAGYNAGPGAVRKYGGVPPYRETQNYVKAVTNNAEQMRSDGVFVAETDDTLPLSKSGKIV